MSDTSKIPDVFLKSGEAEGLELWRVENFEPRLISTNDHGKFHIGDSYLVLHTIKYNNKLIYDLFFWIGSESTQDEYGAVAMWAVYLDN